MHGAMIERLGFCWGASDADDTELAELCYGTDEIKGYALLCSPIEVQIVLDGDIEQIRWRQAPVRRLYQAPQALRASSKSAGIG
jgi:hypothetical protein